MLDENHMAEVKFRENGGFCLRRMGTSSGRIKGKQLRSAPTVAR